MIAYFYKSYSDGYSQYFNFNLVEGDQTLLSLIGVHFELNFTENDLINKANEIVQLFPDYQLTDTIIDYADSTLNSNG